MAKEHSFDIVSKVESHILKDVLNVADKTIKSRYDLKEGTNSIEYNEKDNILTFIANSDISLRALKEIFTQNAIKKNISTKAFEEDKKENAFSGHIRLTIKVKNGIDKENASKISKIIKDSGLKVKSQIQDEQIRVTSKDIDTLQATMKLLQADESISIALQYSNFR